MLGGLATLMGVGLAAWRWVRHSVSILPGPPRESDSVNTSDSRFDPDAAALLLAVADVIVPGDADAPAASEIDFLPTLERWIGMSPERERIYAAWWPVFERALRRRIPPNSSDPEPEGLDQVLEAWHREYQLPGASVPARFFEQLRRDTLRLYYASPAGWASVGYAGPVTSANLAAGRGESAL